MTYWNPPDPTQQQPYEAPRPPRRRRLLWGVGAGVVAARGIVGGVLAATSGVPASAPAPPRHHHRARHAVRGTVASEHGDTWTLKTPKGQTVTVTIPAQTA